MFYKISCQTFQVYVSAPNAFKSPLKPCRFQFNEKLMTHFIVCKPFENA